MQNGEVYTGDWSEGEKNGQGQYEFATGDLYEGYWLNGKRHGKGVYRWKNGETYNGDWRNDRMNGLGVILMKYFCFFWGDFIHFFSFSSKKRCLRKLTGISMKEHSETMWLLFSESD